MELIEIIIHPTDANDPVAPSSTDEEREKKWRIINARHPRPECPSCVWGIQNMDDGIPVYCNCNLGNQHLNRQPPWYINLSTQIIGTLQKWLKN